MQSNGTMAKFALIFGLLFGAGGAAQANLQYSFATPTGVVLQFVETDFIPADYSVAPYQLDANGGTGFFDQTDDTTFYFSSVIPANQSLDYVGLQVALAAIPTAIGQFPVTSYLFVSFDPTTGQFIRTPVTGGQLAISEVPFGGPRPPVPEPATWALMALGVAGMAWVRRRSRGA